MTRSARPSSRAGAVARLGFADSARALRLLEDPHLAGIVDPMEDVFADGVVRALADTADPDQALLALVRLLEAVHRDHAASERRGQDRPDLDPGGLHALVRSPGQPRDRLLAVLGASSALGDHLVRHPEHWRALTEPPPRLPDDLVEGLLRAVGADPADAVPVARTDDDGGTRGATDALRVAYRRRLLALAGRDLAHPDPAEVVDRTSLELADLASAALEAALAVARAEEPDHGAGCRIAVIGMGKCGGRELNYVSDVDVIHVVEPAEGVDEDEALATGTRLATALARVCSAQTSEGTLWPVDAALRPEGRAGPLVRTLRSHEQYYDRWARTWEFQALLKARPVAGDRELGAQYVERVASLAWQAAGRKDFVPDVQAMRRRVEQHVPSKEADRQLKLGPGGLRDVEFSVQLLQMVHGRTEEQLRTGNTLEAIEQLSTYGFIGRDDAAALDRAYRDLRVIEHRLQLARLRRTHLLPTSDDDLVRLAASARHEDRQALERRLRDTRALVRSLHERLFYRPVTAAAARLSADEVRLTTEAAQDRLHALGYHDPAGAMRHLEALTEGVSRRAAIQRQLLPVLLGWFAEGADPDAGLLAFRKVSEALGTTHWYLKMLRDSGAAAERMARVLSSGQYAAELLARSPESTRWLGDDAELAARPVDRVTAEAERALQRHDEAAPAVASVRGVRTREVLRTAIADLAGLADLREVGHRLSDAAQAAVVGALAVAERTVLQERSLDEAPARLAVIGMGRLGGRELGYGSDADVLFVHDPVGDDAAAAQEFAHAVLTQVRASLRASGPTLALDLDLGLRPEGRDGPLVRSLDSYRRYYERWSAGWESQALLRAVPIAGDDELGRTFCDLVDPLRYPQDGLDDAAVRELRRIKARVESERLPRGTSPRRHLKLGPGGLADVEWTAQLLQLQHAGRHPALRTTSTLDALRAAEDQGLLAPADRRDLEASWVLASRLRNALVLWRGRPTDVMPTARGDLDGLAQLVAGDAGTAGELEDEVLRTMRHCRTVVERVFYG
ncbi:bifunctional [glutamine synthetase] adenylyltransferase/[glutamine synthetase]-adenylyl-L-tyrosine phosphorylase [Angustibacter speluncae]